MGLKFQDVNNLMNVKAIIPKSEKETRNYGVNVGVLSLVSGGITMPKVHKISTSKQTTSDEIKWVFEEVEFADNEFSETLQGIAVVTFLQGLEEKFIYPQISAEAIFEQNSFGLNSKTPISINTKNSDLVPLEPKTISSKNSPTTSQNDKEDYRSDGLEQKNTETNFESFEDMEKHLQQLIHELKDIAADDPRNKEKLMRNLDLAMLQVLTLAVGITDNPKDNLKANFMQYIKDENNLVITRINGIYPLYRLRRTFQIGDEKVEGTCGKSWRHDEIKIIPNCSNDPNVFLPYPREVEELGGLINIPVKTTNGNGGVINIDSTVKDVLNPSLFLKCEKIKKLMNEIITLKEMMQEK